MTGARTYIAGLGERPEAGHVYIAPSGRFCTLCPDARERSREQVVTMLYHTADGRPARSQGDEGFLLSSANWHLLRRLS